MKLFLLGKSAGVTHWLEDAAGGLRAAGHAVEVGFTRRPWLSAAVERALESAFVATTTRRIGKFDPDLVLVIGGFHASPDLLSAVASIAGRAPLIGWVGDLFDDGARALADLYDAIHYTDSGLQALHRRLGFAPPAGFLPHAVNPTGASTTASGATRRNRMVFVANPTAHRRAVVAGVSSAMTLYGPTWRASPGVDHEIHPRRVGPNDLRDLYVGHAMALNIRNEHHVLTGLNQRNFEPCLCGAALVTDAQPDLALCFEPGAEVLAWRDVEELNALYDRLLRSPAEAAAIGDRARRRVLADHTYAKRLEALGFPQGRR